ncbi:hypothetical protein BPA30113_02954 [Burkholderia paludis]|uniref:Uncharacterized protein n=1 Tax=Burkholderia paludis TaxID=1506587 RepID=A0A6P2LGL7_9BURK|nr:hypothetical protein LMG30113_01908 [Burkholderia paludis]VWB66095.1 hypothetical protein BPA30113_02954 [Burkholderia paludis]
MGLKRTLEANAQLAESSKPCVCVLNNPSMLAGRQAGISLEMLEHVVVLLEMLNIGETNDGGRAQARWRLVLWVYYLT